MKRSPQRLQQITPDTAPRQRILAAARELFYQQGIRAVGVDAIADAALTNKMTLYRHFGSKDELVAAYLQSLADESDARWNALKTAHPKDFSARLEAWLSYVEEIVNDHGERGCAMANAAVELPESDHPARRIIDEYKTRKREQLVELFRGAGYLEPEIIADEVFLLFEGARIAKQCCNGPDGPASRLIEMLRALLKQHRRRRPGERIRGS
ncbi:MAG: TetR/AcrR family transcriptional regulator [Hyphomicrobiaceae bacterium]